MACSHLGRLRLAEPRFNQPVEREICTQCFDGQDLPDGVDVCLTCFNGGCPRLHAQAHADKFPGHEVAVNIRRTKKHRSQSLARSDGEPPHKRLAIREEAPEHEKYDFHTKLKCYGCGGVEIEGNMMSDAVVSAILQTSSSAKQSEVKAWEAELQTCRHSTDLAQEAAKKLDQAGLAHCSQCELTGNLWLCLTCGSLSCGRQQFGGVGGNGHALQHFNSTHHPLSIKLGTIEPDGTADIYCYACEEERTDPHLAEHLSHWAINVAQQTKTEKSLTELQVEQNLKFDFAMTGEDGKDLQPLFGPGLTGLSNLGNSCYMASILQTLFALPEFADRYFTKGSAHSLLCPKTEPASCFECQMAKIADGLLSGRYALPRAVDAPSNDDATAEFFAPGGVAQTPDGAPSVQSQPTQPFQEGLRPSGFKALVGKDLEEFRTMRQQDGEEFLKHLLQMIQRDARSAGATDATMLDDESSLDPTRIFQFELEDRLQCTECKGVRYKTVGEETLSIPVPFIEKIPDDAAMDVDSRGKAPIEGENAQPQGLAPNTSGNKTEWQSVQLEECLSLLTSAGTIEYKCPRCDKNVLANKSTKFHSFPNVLILHAKRFRLHNWVPEKVDVPIILPTSALSLDTYLGSGKRPDEDELPQEATPSIETQYDAAAMAQLEGMGFPTIRCQKALLATGNSDAEAAMNWLFAHMDDADIDTPIVQAPSASADSKEPSQDQISMVTDMGFTAAQARKALRETGGAVDRAVDWLFSHPDDMGEESGAFGDVAASSSAPYEARGNRDLPALYKLKAFVSHRGPSVHSGHYVAHIYKDGIGWVLFNDEKVVSADGGAQSADTLAPFAYLYVFEKVDASVVKQ